ncbi:DUF3619 family protein [Piscinibacterium candidicorallinum]|jgi:hypothetical protein|uniref:DUF3619 family protein n=1 Tax=Piscinibacterium candidicorallinum TaxID=1793872 RepID=A0ABV7GY75_9BURK
MTTSRTEIEIAKAARAALNASAARLPDAQVHRLGESRRIALSRRKQGTSAAWSLGGSTLGLSGWWAVPAGAASAFALVLGLSVYVSPDSDAEVAEVAAIDTQVLSDELPLEAYLDKGFAHYAQQGE